MAKIRVHIIGAGLSGAALANGLLNDPQKRFQVEIFERDDLAFNSERGGYQIRLGQDGIGGLKQCLDRETYEELTSVWGHEISRAPAIVNPITNKVVFRLADLKIYPKSRAVPRSALKEYLLRLPLKENIVRLNKRLTNVETRTNADGRDSVVVCSFEDGTQSTCDILIAADGANSVVNKCLGLNNMIRIPKVGVQGRGPISHEVYDKLPEVLRENGALLAFGGTVEAFTAVYKTEPDASGKDGSFLFWGINLSRDVNELVSQQPDDESKHRVLMEAMARSTVHPDLLPQIVKYGNQNLKVTNATTSRKPGDWRKGNAALGRIIFIGDSIHPMTPGRGQGANQALRDAGELQGVLMRRFGLVKPSDKEALATALEFDHEMYPRAFSWVASSERASSIDLEKWHKFLAFKLVMTALSIASAGAGVLEMLHLRRPAIDSF